MTDKGMGWTELIGKAKANVEPDIIEQVLPSTGYMIIGGETSCGKTMELMHLQCGFCSAEPTTWHGLKLVQIPALYINCEDNDKKLGERMIEIMPQYKLAIEPQIKLMGGLYLDRQDGIDELGWIVREHRQSGYNVGVVIIDSLKYTCSGDYCKPQTALLWSRNVKELSTKLKAAFVFSHHTRKLVMQQGNVEDIYSADRLKGAKDLIDHSESSFLFATDNRVVRFGDKTNRIKRTVLAPVKTRHAECNLECTLLELEFDRNKLCWNGQKYKINGKEIEVVSTKVKPKPTKAEVVTTTEVEAEVRSTESKLADEGQEERRQAMLRDLSGFTYDSTTGIYVRRGR